MDRGVSFLLVVSFWGVLLAAGKQNSKISGFTCHSFGVAQRVLLHSLLTSLPASIYLMPYRSPTSKAERPEADRAVRFALLSDAACQVRALPKSTKRRCRPKITVPFLEVAAARDGVDPYSTF